LSHINLIPSLLTLGVFIQVTAYTNFLSIISKFGFVWIIHPPYFHYFHSILEKVNFLSNLYYLAFICWDLSLVLPYQQPLLLFLIML